MNNPYFVPSNAQAHAIAGYLYRHLGEPMPYPVLDSDGELDIEADNVLLALWSSGSDPTVIDIELIKRFVVDLHILCNNLPEAEDYMAEFFNAAKRTFDDDKTQIRTWFMWLYLIVLQVPNGPRWGDFVEVYGVANFVEKVRLRLFDIGNMGEL